MTPDRFDGMTIGEVTWWMKRLNNQIEKENDAIRNVSKR